MKNREYLNGLNLCDMLFEMNYRLVTRTVPPCIMSALGVKNPDDRCKSNASECAKCIRTWLNEEKR